MKTNLIFPVLAIAMLLTGCGSTPSGQATDSTGQVCDEFAAYVKDGQPADMRSEVVSSMGDVIGNADPAVQEAHQGLTRTVDKADSAWGLAADVFAQSCFDAGWKG